MDAPPSRHLSSPRHNDISAKAADKDRLPIKTTDVHPGPQTWSPYPLTGYMGMPGLAQSCKLWNGTRVDGTANFGERYAGTESIHPYGISRQVCYQHAESHTKGGDQPSRVGLETNGIGIDPTSVTLQGQLTEADNASDAQGSSKIGTTVDQHCFTGALPSEVHRPLETDDPDPLPPRSETERILEMEIRENLGIPPEKSVKLSNVPQGDDGYPLAATGTIAYMAKAAIWASPGRVCTVKGINTAMRKVFAGYRAGTTEKKYATLSTTISAYKGFKQARSSYGERIGTFWTLAPKEGHGKRKKESTAGLVNVVEETGKNNRAHHQYTADRRASHYPRQSPSATTGGQPPKLRVEGGHDVREGGRQVHRSRAKADVPYQRACTKTESIPVERFEPRSHGSNAESTASATAPIFHQPEVPQFNFYEGLLSAAPSTFLADISGCLSTGDFEDLFAAGLIVETIGDIKTEQPVIASGSKLQA
ncbi:hypothetical protein CONPUDRAFT_150711 [Coniophora puteana RWD-64-598 SS2]|uniref:Uncharacterized protein n=1 Tax=Coniophora puteana (strain RWD-64-598) TaxID=741705 RepID=A0A5M3MX40_CONPW|nr:uncharacterized protein CONPUDRAFT_150711 [Coniophora puteana RWD-64-598 SS2]EIW83640.1 hypothetical protein CONPUDRAFT_150711 [Coniophora puteana RWD-64-598 SS2]